MSANTAKAAAAGAKGAAAATRVDSAAAAKQQKVRRVVWTGAIAAVTAVGAWTGAGFKLSHEARAEVQKRHEATTEEKLELLEKQRSELLGKRMSFEQKLRQIEMRKEGVSREESMVGRERR